MFQSEPLWAWLMVSRLSVCRLPQVPGVHATFRHADSGSEESHEELSPWGQENSESPVSQVQSHTSCLHPAALRPGAGDQEGSL